MEQLPLGFVKGIAKLSRVSLDKSRVQQKYLVCYNLNFCWRFCLNTQQSSVERRLIIAWRAKKNGRFKGEPGLFNQTEIDDGIRIVVLYRPWGFLIPCILDYSEYCMCWDWLFSMLKIVVIRIFLGIDRDAQFRGLLDFCKIVFTKGYNFTYENKL